MMGEGFSVADGTIFKDLVTETVTPKKLGKLTIKRGELLNRKIQFTNPFNDDTMFVISSSSPLISFRQRSMFEVVANCYTYIRVQFGVPVGFEFNAEEVEEVHTASIEIRTAETLSTQAIYEFQIEVIDSLRSNDD